MSNDQRAGSIPEGSSAPALPDLVQATLDAAPCGMLLADMSGRIVMANPAIEAIFGYSAADLVARPVETLLPRNARPSHVAQRAAFATDAHVRRLGTGRDLHGLHASGREIPVEIGLSRFTHAGSHYVIASIVDITERRRLEQQALQGQKMEALGRLAGGVAHDFNNILTTILGYANMLQDAPGLEESVRGDIREIEKAGHRAADLTRQLLAFSRRQTVERRIVDVNALIGDLQRMLQRLLGEDIALLLALTHDATTVSADPGQLNQVVLNLAVNARDAMPHGGRLRIETRSVVAGVADGVAAGPLPPPGPFVRISVSDSGTGISPETMERIFEPFFTTKELAHGTGLGLATVKSVVEQAGGHVAVDSTVGVGTTFHVYWPAVAGAPHESTPDQAGELRRGTETVLLVEDDEQLRAFARTTLAGLGYRVLMARDGVEAEALAASHGSVDLLLTDVVLPDGSGRDLSMRLRAARPKLSVLYMSGYDPDAVQQRGVERSQMPFLSKPFTRRDLASLVRQTLDAAGGN